MIEVALTDCQLADCLEQLQWQQKQHPCGSPKLLHVSKAYVRHSPPPRPFRPAGVLPTLATMAQRDLSLNLHN